MNSLFDWCPNLIWLSQLYPVAYWQKYKINSDDKNIYWASLLRIFKKNGAIIHDTDYRPIL